MIISIAIIAAVVLLDQISKLLVVNFLDKTTPLDIIEGVFRFTYVENRGAAFGMLDDSRWVFMIISTVAIIGLFIYLWKFPPEGKWMRVSLCFIIGGGIGNMIDRIFRSGVDADGETYYYVVDFLDFCAFPELWQWVFNVADAFVCVGAGILLLTSIIAVVKDQKDQKAQKAQKDQEAQKDQKNSPDKESASEDSGDGENNGDQT